MDKNDKIYLQKKIDFLQTVLTALITQSQGLIPSMTTGERIDTKTPTVTTIVKDSTLGSVWIWIGPANTDWIQL